MSPSVLGIVTSEPGSDPQAGERAERKKAWAARSRTGCLTCRKRRVKCDEATPVCRRCLVGDHDCRYGALIPLGDARRQREEATDDRGVDLRDVRLWQRRGKSIFMEAEPFDWDHLQAIRYYYEIVRPARPNKTLKVNDPPFDLGRAPFYATAVITTELGLRSKQCGRVLRYGEDPATMSTLWANHARYQNRLLTLANENIRENTVAGKERAITCICHLMIDDLEVESIQWKTHLDGALAYLERIGGAKVVANWSPTIPMPFIRLFNFIIYPNTTTPALKHSLGYSNYTDKQLGVLLDDDEAYKESPFPVEQKLVLIHITRLRYQVATSAVFRSAAISMVMELFRRLISLDIVVWAHKVEGFEPLTNQAVAEINHDAVWLYAILSLPRRVMLHWAKMQPPLASELGEPSDDAYDCHRRLYRSRLLAKLRKLYPELEYPAALHWPLVVAGVAVADGSAEDQAFIDDSLYTIWQSPVGNPCAFLCLTKLREFWASGKTGWEDCFYEPTPC